MMTDTDHRRLGLAIAEGKAYTTQDVPRDLWRLVFMPLAWTASRNLRGVRMVIAVIGQDKTTGQAVNGFPLFFSCTLLKARDTRAVVTYAQQFRVVRKQMLATKP